MSSDMGKRDKPIFDRILNPQYRYDKIFCDLMDKGWTPGEAADLATEQVKEPLTWYSPPEE